MIMLAVTGLVMMYIAVFDGRDGEKITVPIGLEKAAIAEQANSAAKAFSPDSKLVEWIGAKEADRASVFRINDGGTNHMVAVDPYTGEVVETWVRRNGWYDFMSDIHGELLIGTAGDRMIEIAAGFGIVLIITGLYLWWPKAKGAGSAFVPDLWAKGREFWVSLHKVVGTYSALILFVFLLSGLAWAGVWGGKFVQPWSTFPAEKWNNVPLSDETHASMNHGAMKDVPWGLELTKMPLSGSDAGIEGLPEGVPANVDTIALLGHALGYEGRFRVHYPKNATGVWTLSQDSMSNDSEDPTADRTVHIDQYTGKVLADVGFADYSLPAKGMAVGVAFHEGDMGLWNLVLNTVFCLGVIFLSVSGIVMWWIRRPKGSALRVFAPKTPENLPHWRGAMILMLLVSLAFPLVGITLIVVLSLDYLIVKRVPLLRKAFA
ncbi:PepSY-associated TM helix [Roseibium sp. TrichSKD4]|uniref:PepSY-associated TM helix domain-containing protein n=1 Tax=Roseibium sp. TrichSKD4 TaxID=744980 RepID=UPI0001E563BE|nr:PepSY-associated TM helix [Roseibium sp. TrichSKD4]